MAGQLLAFSSAENESHPVRTAFVKLALVLFRPAPLKLFRLVPFSEVIFLALTLPLALTFLVLTRRMEATFSPLASS